jgi:hypothetical protein
MFERGKLLGAQWGGIGQEMKSHEFAKHRVGAKWLSSDLTGVYICCDVTQVLDVLFPSLPHIFH